MVSGVSPYIEVKSKLAEAEKKKLNLPKRKSNGREKKLKSRVSKEELAEINVVGVDGTTELMKLF